MRKFLLIVSGVLCAGLLAVVAAPASASTTSRFQATFQRHFGAGVTPLPCDTDICGTGTVAGYGEATNSTTVTSFTRIPGTDCSAVTATATITLSDGSTLTYEASATRCPVGNSRNAPGSAVSYGNPISATGTFTITDGTGVFAGASGTGTFIDYFAGDVEVVELSGTITLP
jgi:hypothetical protein